MTAAMPLVTGTTDPVERTQHQRPKSAPSIVFFEQPSIPVHPVQRRFLCQELKQLAEAWPEHPVIFKPRTSSIESTLHRRHGEMAGVIDRMSETVPNLKLSFKPATRLLRQCGCAITVSSTAALEAMAMGMSTRIVGDLGVTETLGNHFFAASGAITSFAAIRRDPFSPLPTTPMADVRGLQRRRRHGSLHDALLQRLTCLRLTPLPARSRSVKLGQHVLADTTPLKNGGRRMLSSGGARSSQRNATRPVIFFDACEMVWWASAGCPSCCGNDDHRVRSATASRSIPPAPCSPSG